MVGVGKGKDGGGSSSGTNGTTPLVVPSLPVVAVVVEVVSPYVESMSGINLFTTGTLISFLILGEEGIGILLPVLTVMSCRGINIVSFNEFVCIACFIYDWIIIDFGNSMMVSSSSSSYSLSKCSDCSTCNDDDDDDRVTIPESLVVLSQLIS